MRGLNLVITCHDIDCVSKSRCLDRMPLLFPICMYLPFRVVLYSYANHIIYHKLLQNSCISNTTVSCAVIVSAIALSEVLIPAFTQDSSVLLTVRTGFEAQPASCSVANASSFPTGKTSGT